MARKRKPTYVPQMYLLNPIEYAQYEEQAAPPPPPPPSEDAGSYLEDVAGSLISGVGSLIQFPANLYSLATGDLETAVGDFGKSISDYGDSIKSPTLQALERESGARIAEAEKEGFWSGVGTGLTEYISEPRLLLSGIAETVPSLFGSYGAGALVKSGSKRLLARELAEQAAAREAAIAAAASTGATARIGTTAAERAVQRAATAGGVGFGAAQQGSEVGVDTYAKAMQLPDEVWVQNPDFVARVQAGEDPTEVKQDMALSAARQSAIAATGVSALTAGLLPGTFEKIALGKSLAGQGLLARTGKGFAGEFGQEFAEEGGGALSRNIALQQINPEQALLEGVGSQAAIGGLLGGFGGGLTGAAFGGEAVEGGRPEAGGILPPAAPSGPLIPPGAPSELAIAPALSTIEIPPISSEEGARPTVLSILSEPDEGGNVWVRTEEGRVTSVPTSTLAMLAEGYTPVQPVVIGTPVTEPTTETPVGVEPIGITPTVSQPEGAPAVEPAPTVIPPVVAPPEGVAPVGVSAPEGPTVGTPPIGEPPIPPSPVGGTIAGVEPIDVTDIGVPPEPVAGEVTAPQPPATEPVVGEDIAPEDIDQVFTQEENLLADQPNKDLADAIRGKQPVQVADYIVQNAMTPFHRRVMQQVGGMMRALEKQGYKFGFQLVGQTTKPIDKDRQVGAKMSTVGRFKKTDALGAVYPYLDEQNNYAGFRRSDILIRDINVPLKYSGASDNTITHEFIHAVTSALIRQYQRGKISPASRVGKAIAELEVIQQEVAKRHRDIMKDTSPDSLKAREILRGLSGNAFNNVHELLANGLTDWRMQYLLKQIEVKKVNGFTAFVRAIGRMLGLTEADTNGLRRFLELSEELLPSDTQRQTENALLTMGREPTPTTAQDAIQREEELIVPYMEIGEAQEPLSRPDDQQSVVDESGPTEVTEIESGLPFVQISEVDEKWTDRWRRRAQNEMRRLGFIEEKIAQALGRPLQRTERATETAALFEGRVEPRLEALQRDHINKIVQIMARDKIDPKEADMFLLARTAPWRNAKIARRNPRMPDGGSGMTNELAQRTMADIIARGDMPKMQRLAEAVDAMTAATRQAMVDYGLISQRQADFLVQEEPFYVPLKGKAAADGDLTTSGEMSFNAPGAGRGFSISRKEYLAAKGRISLPFSPLANAVADAQTTIIRGEKNRIGQAFLNKLVRKYDSNAWQVFTDERPDMTTGYVGSTNKVKAVPVNMAANADKYFIVKESGKPYYIKINDKLLMRALTKASSKDFSALNTLLGNSIGMVTRTLSQLHTTLQPEFFIPNFVRDIEAAVFNILAEQDAVDGRLAGKKIVQDVLKDLRPGGGMFKNLLKATFNHKATTADQHRINALFQQAKEDGAFTGWLMYSTPERKMAELKKELDKATATGKKKIWYSTQAGARGVLEKIQDFNSVFENVTRLTVYKHALKALSEGVPAGRIKQIVDIMIDRPGIETEGEAFAQATAQYTPEEVRQAKAECQKVRDQAANMARGVTVDFNKKGEWGPTANAFYAFFNASVQGTAQLYRSLVAAKTPDGRRTMAQKLAMGMFGLGLLTAVIARGISDEDDDGALFYDKIPDYEKERNLVIMVTGKEYIKIPMAYGYSLFSTMGTNLADAIAGKKTAADLGVGLVSGLINNFSPIPFSGQSLKGIAASVVPTALRPVADLAINENFWGTEIYNEPFDEGQAKSSVSRYSTPEGYKAVVEFLNDATGGYGKVPGKIDLPAESLQYLVNYYAGGAGRFIGKTWDFGKGFATEKGPQIKDMPIGSKVLGQPNQQNDLGLYYDRLTEIKPIERQLRDSKGQERQFVREKFPVETDVRVIGAMKTAQAQLKAINKQKKALLEREMAFGERQDQLDKLNDRAHDVYLRFNRVYNQVENTK